MPHSQRRRLWYGIPSSCEVVVVVVVIINIVVVVSLFFVTTKIQIPCCDSRVITISNIVHLLVYCQFMAMGGGEAIEEVVVHKIKNTVVTVVAT